MHHLLKWTTRILPKIIFEDFISLILHQMLYRTKGSKTLFNQINVGNIICIDSSGKPFNLGNDGWITGFFLQHLANVQREVWNAFYAEPAASQEIAASPTSTVIQCLERIGGFKAASVLFVAGADVRGHSPDCVELVLIRTKVRRRHRRQEGNFILKGRRL